LMPGDRFIYYPLHVPNDAALTIRSPEYLDQYAFLDYAAGNLPMGYNLYIKEHPARVGAIDYGSLRRLLIQHDNLKIIDPTINNYDVMEAADVVITINSKSGAEAMLLGKPVIALGDAFYTPSRLVLKPERLEDLPALIKQALENRQRSNPDDVRRYFQNVWNQSWFGEIHYAEPENIRIFAQSLCDYLSGAAVKSS